MSSRENRSMRSKRKVDHLNAAALQVEGLSESGLDDVVLVHNCLPEVDLSEVRLDTCLCGYDLRSPVIIDAITGGAEESERVNAILAQAARKWGMAMAVGSQTTAIEEGDVGARKTFQVVRRENPNGIVMANVGASVPPDWAVRAIEMIQANILQLHLNAAHELAMKEGERRFSGILRRIEEIVRRVEVPVMVKEVGFGIAREQAALLASTGIRSINIGGKGGTNFVAIEAMRSDELPSRSALEWGIPTCVSLVEVVMSVGSSLDIVASGGFRSGLDVAKGLALGAVAVGIAGLFVRLIVNADDDEATELLDETLGRIDRDLRRVMLLCGACETGQLRKHPVVILGRTAEWLRARNIDVSWFANRGGASTWC